MEVSPFFTKKITSITPEQLEQVTKILGTKTVLIFTTHDNDLCAHGADCMGHSLAMANSNFNPQQLASIGMSLLKVCGIKVQTSLIDKEE